MIRKMDLRELAKPIHENAVAHGFWEDGRMTLQLGCALINCEWAEALEEDRAGRPMHYYNIGPTCDEEGCPDEPENTMICEEQGCILGKKPEGTAVEIADGVIRILDLMEGFGMDPGMLGGDVGGPLDEEQRKEMDIASVKNVLDWSVASAAITDDADEQRMYLFNALNIAIMWLWLQGFDAEAVIREKMAYNEHRERLHGKRY